MLKDIPIGIETLILILTGTMIHNICLRVDGPAQLCRSAGTSAQLLSTGKEGFAHIKLTSKEVRMFPVNACATIGIGRIYLILVANEQHKLRVLGKAGASRRLGWRPSVRGIAMNANSHPHGGGRKNIGVKAPKSPWGWLTKGPKTVNARKKWFVVTPRWKAKQ